MSEKFILWFRDTYSKLWLHKGYAVRDVPDPRDYLTLPTKFGGQVKDKWKLLPRKVFLFDDAEKLGVEFEWQDKKPETMMSCTAFALMYGVKITNSIRKNVAVILSEEIQWENQKATGQANTRDGATLQNALETFRKNDQGESIAKYTRVKPNRWIKDIVWESCCQLAKGHCLYTAVHWKGDNWGKLVATGIYYLPKVGRKNGGHAICIMGYNLDENVAYVWQSIDKKFGANRVGLFEVPFSELKNMMSIYALEPYEVKNL